jgi:LPXTG-motif cell wall-anchored protein
MQKRMKNRFKNFLIVTLSILMMMPSTIAAFAKEGKDEEKIEKLELSATYSDYDIVATAEKDALPEGATLHVKEVAKDYQELSDMYLTEEDKYETAMKQYFSVYFEDADGNKIQPTKKIDLSLRNEKLGDKNVKTSLFSISAEKLVEMKKDMEKVKAEKEDGKEAELQKFEFKPLETKKPLDDEKKLETSIEKLDEVYMIRYSYQPKTLNFNVDSISYDELLAQTGLVGEIQKLEVSNSSYIVAKDQMIEKVEDFSSEMFALVTINGMTYKVNFAPTVKANEENAEDVSLRSVERNTTVKDVHIGDFNTKLVGGVDKGTNIWTVPTINTGGYAAGHMFVFRVNFSISGVDEVGENAVMFTVPKSILLNRNGQASDKYEMSIPHQREVDAMMAGTGEPIDKDVSFAYYEDGDNIVIYNFRKLAAGTEGYVEVGYKTLESSYEYRDMAESKPFTAKMELGSEVRNADPLTAKINTTASIESTSLKYPTKFKTWWEDKWGTKPADADNYIYLGYVVESSILATQPYDFEIVATPSNYEIAGYVMGGKFQTSNKVTNQKGFGKRYDQVILRIPKSEFTNKTYLNVTLNANSIVSPLDQIDAKTQKSSKQDWSWSKPVFSIPTGHFNVHKRGDRVSEEDKNNGTRYVNKAEFSRYDLESFNGYENAAITNTEYGGFDYYSDILGYPYPWTRDENMNPNDPNAYGRKVVKYQYTDEGLYLATEEEVGKNPYSDQNKFTNDNALSSEDAYIEKVYYEYAPKDVEYEQDEATFVLTHEMTFTDDDVITLWVKAGNDDYKSVGTYNFRTNHAEFDNQYVSTFTNNDIVFSRKDIIAYRFTFANKHYFTGLYAYPSVTLKNSQKVLNYVNGKETIAIVNNINGKFFTSNGEEIVSIDTNAADYARVTQRISEITKKVVSSSNNSKKKIFTITWKVEAGEKIISGQSGEVSYLPQKSGTFYDLLPLGSTLDPASVIVQNENGQKLSSSSYTVKTVDNFNGSGRTLVRVDIKEEASKYKLFLDTVHSWNAISDYGVNVYNPVAYKTGNDTIKDGTADNGGRFAKDGSTPEHQIIENLANVDPDEPDDWQSGVTKFIYAEEIYDINNLTAATSGLVKKVKAEKDKQYSYETSTNINRPYSYEIRMANSGSTKSKNIVLFDSLENYITDNGSSSDWHGTLNSIDVNQLKSKGVDPVVYISKIENLSIDDHHDLSDASVWEKVTDATDLSTAKAIAIDASKKKDGSSFILNETESLTAYLYMTAPSSTNVEGRVPMAYNNIYMNATIFGGNDKEETHLVHQDYTQIGLKIAGSFNVKKVSENDNSQAIKNIQYRLSGVSAYGTAYDEIVTTDRNGFAIFKDIELGSYTLQEHKSTPDWLLDATTRNVVVTKTGEVLIDGVKYAENPLLLADKPRVHTDISLSKLELGNKNTKVPGMVFKLYGTSDYGNNVVIFATSNNSGEVVFENVEKGKYIIKEVSSENPDYVINKDLTINVTIDDFGGMSFSGNDNEYYNDQKVYNERRFNSFRLRKIDKDNTSIWLEGAEFSLKGTSAFGTSVDIVATSDENGVMSFENIERGTYTLKEVKAPENVTALGKKGGNRNYIKDPSEYIVNIDKLGNVTIDGLTVEDGTGNFIVKNERAEDGKIVVKKVWNDADKNNADRPLPQLTLTTGDPTNQKYAITLDFSSVYGAPANARYKMLFSKEEIQNADPSTFVSNKLIPAFDKIYNEKIKGKYQNITGNINATAGMAERQLILEGLNTSPNGTDIPFPIYTPNNTFLENWIKNPRDLTFYYNFPGRVSYFDKGKFQDFINSSSEINHNGKFGNDGSDIRFDFDVRASGAFMIASERARGRVLTEISTNDSPYKTYAYIDTTSSNPVIKVLSEADTVFLPEDSSELFAGAGGNASNKYVQYDNLYLTGLDASKVKSMEKMFAYQQNLGRITFDKSMLGTNGNSNVLNYEGLFYQTKIKNPDRTMLGFHLKAGNNIKANNALHFNLGTFDNKELVGMPIGFDISNIGLPTQDPRNFFSPFVESNDMGIFGDYPNDSRIYFNLNGSEYIRLSRSIKNNKEYYKKVFNSLLKNVNKNSYITLYVAFTFSGRPGEQDLLSEGVIQKLLREIGYTNVSTNTRQAYSGVYDNYSMKYSGTLDYHELGWRVPEVTSENSEPQQNEDGTITYRSQADKWVKGEDNVWTYTFNVFDDTLEYKLFEETMDGYTSEAMLPKYAIVNGTQSKVATITNKSTVGTGSFHLSKVVNGELVPGASYTFFLNFSNPNGFFNKPRVLSGVSIFNGHAMVQLKGGQDLVIEGLPQGTVVSVSEQEGAYQATYSAENVTIESGKQADIVCTNTFTPPEPNELGDVTLVKKVSGIADENTEYPFRVEFSNLTPNRRYLTTNDNISFESDLSGHALLDLRLRKDESIRFKDLPVNATYQVTELAGAYTSKYELSDIRGINKFNSENGLNEEENKDLSTAVETVDADENVSITFTNTIEHKQSLVVTKVEPEVTTEKYPFSIQFSNMKPNSFFSSDIGLVRADENGEATKDFTLGNGESVRFTDIPVGVEYKVTELANKKLAQYALTADKGTFVTAEKENTETVLDLSTELETVDDGEDATVTFTNITPPSAKIQLTKLGENNEKLGGATYALYKGEFFIKNIDINENGKSDEVDEISVGKYHLIEIKAPEGYALDPNKHEFEIKKEQLNTTVQIELHDDKLKVLPSTGGQGMILYVIISLMLLGGAGYLVISAKKKEKELK